MAEMPEHPVVLFDGVCNLCTGAVQWIIRHDPQGLFHFASLQSRVVRRLESIVVIDAGREYRRSAAFLQILRRLPKLSWLAYAGAVIPQGIRDLVYEYIAKHRYGWFGKTEECMLPTPELASRFIDQPAAG
jgi:predicted DCC family thiol-disulfide oxidoreductase YuxK